MPFSSCRFANPVVLSIISVCKLDAHQSEDQDILFLLYFEYLCYVFSNLIRLISSDTFDEIRFRGNSFNYI